MSADIDKNEHYITKSFVRDRFGKNGLVERYDVKSDSWKSKTSPRFVFANHGYTQLLIEGNESDHTLEAEFGKAENHLKDILRELDTAATAIVTKVPEDIYKNLCWYCAFLWYLSPFAKAKAPADYVNQLDMDLRNGNVAQLKETGMPEDKIPAMQKLHSTGKKFIIVGDDYLQWVFRVQLRRSVPSKFLLFRHIAEWTVYNSPVELPISDIALVDFPEGIDKARLYILPISPNRVLVGRLPLGSSPPSHTDTLIHGKVLTNESAADILDMICLSAVKTIVCRNRIDVAACRKRAIEKQFGFTQIKDIDAVLSAGLKTCAPGKRFDLMAVSEEEFKQYILSFIAPPPQMLPTNIA